MNRRDFSVAIGTFLSASPVFAQFGGLKNPLGKKDKDKSAGSWSEVADKYLGAKKSFVGELSTQTNVKALIAEALDLQSEAEVLRAEAQNISDKGDALGSGDLDEVSKKTDAADLLVNEKLASAEELSDEQKGKLAEAAATYVPSMIRGIGTAASLKAIADDASNLGAPGLTDGTEVINAAKEIPALVPAMINFTVSSTQSGISLLSALDSKGVAVPDQSELDQSFEDFV